MTLSTEVFTHIIIFFDGSIRNISKERYETILHQSCLPNSKKFVLDGKLYSFGDVKKLYTLNDYYEEYPDKIPPKSDIFQAKEVIPLTIEQIKNNQRGLMRGLKQFIDEQTALGIKTPNAQSSSSFSPRISG